MKNDGGRPLGPPLVLFRIFFNSTSNRDRSEINMTEIAFSPFRFIRTKQNTVVGSVILNEYTLHLLRRVTSIRSHHFATTGL
jgi:hypothetical protein